MQRPCVQSELGMFKETPVQVEWAVGRGRGQRGTVEGWEGSWAGPPRSSLALILTERGAMAGFEGAGAEWGDRLGGSGKNPG